MSVTQTQTPYNLCHEASRLMSSPRLICISPPPPPPVWRFWAPATCPSMGAASFALWLRLKCAGRNTTVPNKRLTQRVSVALLLDSVWYYKLSYTKQEVVRVSLQIFTPENFSVWRKENRALFKHPCHSCLEIQPKKLWTTFSSMFCWRLSKGVNISINGEMFYCFRAEKLAGQMQNNATSFAWEIFLMWGLLITTN